MDPVTLAIILALTLALVSLAGYELYSRLSSQIGSLQSKVTSMSGLVEAQQKALESQMRLHEAQTKALEKVSGDISTLKASMMIGRKS